MTGTAYELATSREKSKTDSGLKYLIVGAADEAAAEAALLAAAPTTYGSGAWILSNYRVSEVPGGLFTGDVAYAAKPDNQTTEIGTQTESFDITAQNQKITHAINQVKYSPSSGPTAPDIFGAINVNAKGEVEGCDIFVPTYAFSITKIVAASSVDSSFKFAMMGLVGKVCSDSFGPFDPGEVLFFGLRGSQRDAEAWELAYSFLASPNVTGLSFGGVSSVDKKGWEYLSITYDKQEDTTNYAIVPKVRGVYVSQVYKTASFSALPPPS